MIIKNVVSKTSAHILNSISTSVFASFKKSQLVFLQIKPPKDSLKTPLSTEQLFNFIHGISKVGNPFTKPRFSFEIASSKTEGIRYLLVTDKRFAEVIKRGLISFLPSVKIIEVGDYLQKTSIRSKVIEFKLSGKSSLPLKKQKQLNEYDPVAYLTGNMTKLESGEQIGIQLIVSPIDSLTDLSQAMYTVRRLILNLLILPFGLVVFITTGGRDGPFLRHPKSYGELSTDEIKELELSRKSKTSSKLFKCSIRVYLSLNNRNEIKGRSDGIISTFDTYSNVPHQSLVPKISFIQRLRSSSYQRRSLSIIKNPVLSVSEMSDLYHLPFSDTNQTEDMVKILSPELPAPLSLKTGRDLDVVFATNNYGNQITEIGLTDEERSKHVYIIGRTGSGKSTIIFSTASQDIEMGRGVAVIDPHGDLAEDLLTTIPEGRINDLIYFNPFDLARPIGINLLELKEGLTGDELELEKELVTESVISVFRRIFSKNERVNAHRIEYILRNTIYTAFYVEGRTIFTIYNLLNDPELRKRVVPGIPDINLKNFWSNEFGRAGDYQIVKMVSGVTAKIGRFLFSPSAKRILEQEKSTINFDDILDQGKILICNLAEGLIGEDTSEILGLTVISKIHLAAQRRARVEKNDRKPFYLFVDEFQNFATTSFTKILSGGRKFGLRLTLAEQSTAQQSDRNVVEVILANTGTVICFATASPLDEQMMQPQFAPNISRYDLANLARYNFYIKLASTYSQEPFSGQTLKIEVNKDREKIKRLIEASRNNFAADYEQMKIERLSQKTKAERETGRKIAPPEGIKTGTTRGTRKSVMPQMGS